MPVWTLFYRDQWAPVWPNLEANVIWAAPVIWLHFKHRKHLLHLSKRLTELAKQLEGKR